MTLAASGKLLATMRMAGGYHRLAVSEDAGKTWSEPRDIGLESAGHPASLITLRNGDILCIYGHHQRVNFLASRMIGGEFNIRPEEIEFLNLDAPSAIRIALSHDEGKTWPKQERYTLRDDLQNVDNGYPVSTELPDGRILSVYYYNLFERFVIAGNIYYLPKTERR